MWLRALAVVLLLSGCSSPKEEPKVFETFQITDLDGKPVPESITTVAGDALDFAIAYQGGGIKEFDGDPVQPPEDWRFNWSIQDASGKPMWPMSYFAEFFSYDYLAMEATGTGQMGSAGPDRIIHWVSPEKPPGGAKNLITRWGHVRLPAEPGEYTLQIMAYPAADPRMPGEGNPILRTKFLVLSVAMTLTAPEPGKEPVRINQGNIAVSTGRKRKLELQRFGRLSEELAARMKAKK